jgi:hypothetical protein
VNNLKSLEWSSDNYWRELNLLKRWYLIWWMQCSCSLGSFWKSLREFFLNCCIFMSHPIWISKGNFQKNKSDDHQKKESFNLKEISVSTLKKERSK